MSQDSIERTWRLCRHLIDRLPRDLDLGQCNGEKIHPTQHLLMRSLAITVPGDIGYRYGVYDEKLLTSWLVAPDGSMLAFTGGRGSLVIYNDGEVGSQDLLGRYQPALLDPDSSLARLERCPAYWVAVRRVCREFRRIMSDAVVNHEDLTF